MTAVVPLLKRPNITLKRIESHKLAVTHERTAAEEEHFSSADVYEATPAGF